MSMASLSVSPTSTLTLARIAELETFVDTLDNVDPAALQGDPLQGDVHPPEAPWARAFLAPLVKSGELEIEVGDDVVEDVSQIPWGIAINIARQEAARTIEALRAAIAELETAAAPEVAVGLVETPVVLDEVVIEVEAPAETKTATEAPAERKPSRSARRRANAHRRAFEAAQKAAEIALAVEPAPQPAPAPVEAPKAEAPRGVVSLPAQPVETVVCTKCGLAVDVSFACVPHEGRLKELVGREVRVDDLSKFVRCKPCANHSGRTSAPFLKARKVLREGGERRAAPKAKPSERSPTGEPAPKVGKRVDASTPAQSFGTWRSFLGGFKVDKG